MNKEKICFSSKTIELSENENYIELTNRVCYYNAPNLNGVELPYDESSEEKAQTLVDMPVVAKYTTNSQGEPTFKGHEVYYDEDGNLYFGTDNIGTHTETYIKDDTVVTDLQGTTQVLPCLFAKYRVWKRNQNVVDAVHRLYDEGKLYSSWEIQTISYTYNNGIKTLTDYVFLSNCLLGYEYAYPAYGEDAKAIQMSQKEVQLLVAEAFSKDIIEHSVSNINNSQEKEDSVLTKSKETENSETSKNNIDNVDELESTIQTSESSDGVVPKNISKEKAPEDTEWSAPTLSDFTDKSWDELTDDEKKKIAQHYAWAKEMPPTTFGDLKLPHHEASDGKVVWNAVANAAARLDQTDLPSGIIDKVKSHLEAHYHQFDKKAPWEEENSEVNNTDNEDSKKKCESEELQVEESKAKETETEKSENNENSEVETKNTEKAELTDNDVMQGLYNAISEKLGVPYYYFCIIANMVTSNTCWVQRWDLDNSSELDVLVFTYTVDNDVVTVSDPTEAKLSVSVSQINSTISELDTKIKGLTNSLVEASTKIQEASKQITELKPYKEAADVAEQQRIEAETIAKRDALKAYATKSGFIVDDEFVSDEKIKSCIDNVDESGIKAIIAERFVASLDNKKDSDVETSTTKETKTNEVETSQVKSNITDNSEDNVDYKSIMKSYIGK